MEHKTYNGHEIFIVTNTLEGIDSVWMNAKDAESVCSALGDGWLVEQFFVWATLEEFKAAG